MEYLQVSKELVMLTNLSQQLVELAKVEVETWE